MGSDRPRSITTGSYRISETRCTSLRESPGGLLYPGREVGRWDRGAEVESLDRIAAESQLEPGIVVTLPGSVHRVSAPGALGDVHRHIGVAQQGQRVLAMVRIHI